MIEATGTDANSLKSSQLPKLNSLQLLRGIAALAVAIYHTNLILAQPEYGSQEIFSWFSQKGWMGVNLFFVLSGFIITYAHHKDFNRPKTLPSYFWKRFARVYPIYWICTSIYVGAAVVGIGHPNFSFDLVNLLSAYALIKFSEPLTLPLMVAWTLLYEVMFYALFSVLLINLRFGLIAFLIWAIGIIVSSLVFDNTEFGLFNIWNIYFLIGCACYYVHIKLRPGLALALLPAGLILLVFLGMTVASDRVFEAQKDPWQLLVLAMPFALILIGVLALERQNMITPPRALKLLGDASYSVYLVHSPVISLLAQLNNRFIAGWIPGPVLFIGICTIAVALGVVVHIIIERPLLSLSRRIIHSAFPARFA